MGFALCGLALIVLYILIEMYAGLGDGKYSMEGSTSSASAKRLFECIAGYGLGGSSMALFGRVGGGIFTKGSDLFGSFAEASCAALVISASSPEIVSVGSSAF